MVHDMTRSRSKRIALKGPRKAKIIPETQIRNVVVKREELCQKFISPHHGYDTKPFIGAMKSGLDKIR